MISQYDARYVIKEIRNRRYYAEKIREYDDQIREIDRKILDVTAPHSPSIEAEPHGSQQTHEQRWAALFDEKDVVETERALWAIKKTRAERYYQILMRSGETEFVRDFFNGTPMEAVEMKHHYANAYRTMVRYVRRAIRKI